MTEMENYPDYETVDYHLVYGELIRAARNRGTVTYQELTQVVGLPLSGNWMGKRLGDILGTVLHNEVNQRRPMLSALAIKTMGKRSIRFKTLASASKRSVYHKVQDAERTS
jgi:hypothetical protein